MKCDQAHVLMVKRLHEALTPEAGSRLEKHLARCAACRAELDGDAAFEAHLRHAIGPGPAPAGVPGVDPARILRRLHQARGQARSTPRPAPRGWAWAAASLVVLVAALVATAPPASRQAEVKSPLAPSRARGLERVRKHLPTRSASVPPRKTPQPAHSREGGPPAPAHTRARRTGTAAPRVVPDDRYLDGYSPALAAQWLSGDPGDREIRRLLEQELSRIQVQDDFVQVPFPRIASTGSDPAAARDAVRQFRKEAGVVDPRLFRKVTLQLKAAPLSELCEALRTQTQVSLRATRGVADENVTVFVRDVPARDVLRAVARLFGYRWLRTGEEGRYRYELSQDLRAQLAEEEMRSRDVHAAVLDLDERLAAFDRYLALTPQELKARRDAAEGAERERLSRLLSGEWAGLHLYRRLTPGQRAALLAGETLNFEPNAANPALRIPPELRTPFLQASGLSQVSSPRAGIAFSEGDENRPPIGQVPGAQPLAMLSLDRSDLGQVQLRISTGAYIDDRPEFGRPMYGFTEPPATGRSPATARPDNARANAALLRDPAFQRHPAFQQVVSIKPASTCPVFAPGKKEDAAIADMLDGLGYVDVNGLLRRESGPERPHVESADVWEAVHRESGVSVVADAYTRLFEQPQVTVEKKRLPDALNSLADRMGARWTKDGEFLLVRSTSYFWDKLKEVPKGQLRRWSQARAERKGLPLQALLEIASLSDSQLDAVVVGRAIEHCWRIGEWGVVGNAGFRYGIHHSELRPYARFLAQLTTPQLAAAQGEGGLALEALQPAQRQALAQLLLNRGHSPDDLRGLRFRVLYAASGEYVWEPVVVSQDAWREAARWPLVAAGTAEEALAAARRLSPRAKPDEIGRCKGVFGMQFQAANGEAWSSGGPEIHVRSGP